MFLERESYLNEYHRRQQLAELESRHLVSEERRSRKPHTLRFADFWHTLRHLSRVRIEVKFEYHKPHPDVAGC